MHPRGLGPCKIGLPLHSSPFMVCEKERIGLIDDVEFRCVFCCLCNELENWVQKLKLDQISQFAGAS